MGNGVTTWPAHRREQAKYAPPHLIPRIRELGLIPSSVDDTDVTQTPLPGGVSARIHRVSWHGTSIVTKQALPRLAVQATWTADPARAGREVACIRALARGLGRPSWLPTVLLYDEANCAYVMESAPAGARNWKDTLLSGDVDLDVVRRFAAILAAIHASPLDQDERALFEDSDAFVELRIDPFYRATADRHPRLAGVINSAGAQLLQNRTALVHGDFSPKNMLVWDDGLIVLDYEAAHLGDPAFDLAFMLCHLALTALTLPEKAPEILHASDAFWTQYLSSTGRGDLERRTALHVACLLLARVDGKSPVDHLPDDAATTAVRSVALALLDRPAGTLEDVNRLILTAAREMSS
ncbi:MAG: phosphotransferase [Streptosporangiales bacterium]|nr:phosphotransferase [Streptosporangiales bacterium]